MYHSTINSSHSSPSLPKPRKQQHHNYRTFSTIPPWPLHTVAMSLSFVSKSVLTAKEGGDGYEETPIEGGQETEGSSGGTSSAYSKPLFEQLRANQEQEEQEREDFQKSIMRGTLALDEEDCAHLDAVQQQKHQRDQAIHRETQSELEAFRAAQAVNRIEQGTIEDDDDNEDEDKNKKAVAKPTTTKPATKITHKPFVPKIVVKKKRKKVGAAGASVDAGTSTSTKKPKQQETKKVEVTAMAGLLDGYGSSDSDWCFFKYFVAGMKWNTNAMNSRESAVSWKAN